MTRKQSNTLAATPRASASSSVAAEGLIQPTPCVVGSSDAPYHRIGCLTCSCCRDIFVTKPAGRVDLDPPGRVRSRISKQMPPVGACVRIGACAAR